MMTLTFRPIPSPFIDETPMAATFTCEQCGWSHERRAFDLASDGRLACNVSVSLHDVWLHQCAASTIKKPEPRK